MGAVMNAGLGESMDAVVMPLFCCAIAGMDDMEDLLVEQMSPFVMADLFFLSHACNWTIFYPKFWFLFPQRLSMSNMHYRIGKR